MAYKIASEPRVTPVPTSADTAAALAVKMWREGTLSAAQFADHMAAAGRMFTANMGTVATQLTFLAQAANRPDAWIRVPAGTTIIPWSLDIALGAMAGTVTTIDVRICQNDIGIGTSSAASVGPISSRSDAPVTSGVGARQLATADTTAETNPISVFKHAFIRADDAGSDGKNLHITRDMMKNPFLIGAASWELFIWATTTQATGYAVMTWIETPSTWWV